MSKFLVTGAAGFIASKVVEILCHDPKNVVVGIDNQNGYYDQRLKKHRIQNLSKFQNFEFQPLDIENRDGIVKLFSQHHFDAVLNLAARAGVRYSMENPHVYASTNISGTINLLEQMQVHEVGKFVLASTSSLYAGLPTPFVESVQTDSPISTYAATKKAAELIAYSYHHLYGIDVSVVRYFTVYGPAGRPDMSYFRFISSIARGEPIVIYGDGEQDRDFTYVDDIAKGTIAALKPVGYEIFNLGRSDHPVSINQLIKMIESKLGKKAVIEHMPAHEADMKSTHANIEKAKHILGWQPKTSLDVGIDHCVNWYMEHQDFASTISLEVGD